MSDRRSARSKKSINYAAFGGAEEDDDFADCTPPPTKKAKQEPKKKEKRNNMNDVFAEEEDFKPKKASKRAPRDEKLYERDLLMALELSRNEPPSQSSSADGGTSQDEESDKENMHVVMPELHRVEAANPDPYTEYLPPPTLVRKAQPLACATQSPENDVIELLEEDVSFEEPSRGRRRRATKRVSHYVDSDDSDNGGGGRGGGDDDDDFKLDGAGAAESESDDNIGADDGNDSDFDAGESKKTKAKAKKSTIPKATTKKAEAKPTKTAAPKLSGISRPSINVPLHKSVPIKPAASPSLGPAVPRKTAYKSPAPSASSSASRSPLGGVVLKSPAALRLGLSRKVPVKPLHSSVKTTT